MSLLASAAGGECGVNIPQGIWREETIPGTPQGNMDADCWLMEAVRNGIITCPLVRVYTWDRPSVSHGRMQDEGQVEAEFPGLPLVRRPTGGLAVRHGDDLTITVATRAEWLPPQTGRGVLASYRQIMDGLLEALDGVGVQARLGGAACARQRGSVDCFASVAECDATDARTGRKLVGSAQRRDRGAILQQMSIPRSGIPDAPLFLEGARVGLAHALGVSEWRALGVSEWRFVDSLAPV